MSLERHWFLNGQNYSRTLETWLQRQDRHHKQILPIMEVITWIAALGTDVDMVLLRHSSSWLEVSGMSPAAALPVAVLHAMESARPPSREH